MKKISFVLFLIFFSVGLLTLPHYGPNWDETSTHFTRGQAILHFFLTGKKDYKDLPQVPKYYQKDDDLFFNPIGKNKAQVYRRSIFMDNQINFKFFLNDYGHPPLSDIFSAFFNYIFFQKIGLINDVDSYHIYSIFLSSILVGVIFWWVSRSYGIFAGLISALSLSIYPLFWGESHFNIKDPPEAVFYALVFITLFEGVVRRKNKILMLSSIFAGFAFATKFNIVFAPFSVIPWIFIYLHSNNKDLRKYLRLLPSILVYPLIPFAIIFASWPFLWSSPVQNFLKVVKYYREIGTDASFDQRFLTHFGFNTYAIQWITYSTPLIILGLFFMGVFYSLSRGTKEKDKKLIFILFWFVIPILRVTRPDAGIYGGVRQIMEYIPGMAIIAGIGGSFIVQKLSSLKSLRLNRGIYQILIILLFIPIFIKLIQIHPNEGIYFNELIGGLKGAKEMNLPGWGESLGNPYRQGIRWINQNAPFGSNITINFGTGGNIPWIFLRQDLHLSNQFRSAMQKKGEYIIGLTHNSGYEDTFFLKYLNNFLVPLYQVNVDNIPILKIWRNDLAHTKTQYKNLNLLQENSNSYITGNTLFIDLNVAKYISEIDIKFRGNCEKDSDGSVQISNDSKSWVTLDNGLSGQFLLPFSTYQGKDSFIYYLADEKTRYLEFNFTSDNSCFKFVKDIKVYGFSK